MRWVHKIIDTLFIFAVFGVIVIAGQIAAHELFKRLEFRNYPQEYIYEVGHQG